MFILSYSYRAKPGQKQEILDLYRDWQRSLCQHGLVSVELLFEPNDPLEYVMLARFEDEEAAWAAADCPAYRNWYSRLASLSDSGPIVSRYELQLQTPPATLEAKGTA
jgi:quinol monooxygenase YgiN